jgi:hypothetical protein
VGIEPDEVVEDIELTTEELDHVETINEEGILETFVEAHPGFRDSFDEEAFDSLMQDLEDRGLDIRRVIVRRLIRNELEKNELPPLIDLDYDVQLKYAIDKLNSMSVLTRKAS